MGKKIITRAYTQTISYQSITIDARTYGKGVYWIEVLDKDNKRVGLSRVLIQ